MPDFLKKNHRSVAIFASLLLILFAGNGCKNESTVASKAYTEEIGQWREQRLASLTRQGGWLSLAGLYWLSEGDNTFGSAADNNVVFPQKAPAKIGVISLNEQRLFLKVSPEVKVLNEGIEVREMQLASDENGEPTVLESGTFSWYVIKRDDKFAIRLKDSDNPNFKNFKGLDYYPVRPDWRVKATFVPYDPPKKISVPTIMGTEIEENCPGALEFGVNGKLFRLDAIGSMTDDEWFIIFGDLTNGKETYGAGRFLYVPRPDESGVTYIDFNKSYCPPCAFTEFATCPLPPPQNILALAIPAGEKDYEGSHH